MEIAEPVSPGSMSVMAVISTAPFHGYQVVFSPYSPNKLAFVGAQNYGIAGAGALIVYEETPSGFRETRRFVCRDGLFDVTWSEVTEGVLVAGGGDGGVLIFDQAVSQGPVAVLAGHTAEVSSVHWSVTRQEQFVLSASWDGSVRLWDPQARSCLAVFSDHTGMVYSACWSPYLPHTFASVSGDETLRVWDTSSPPHSSSCVHAHSGEVLACDWSKYDQHTLFTAGVDTSIRGWDIRQLTGPLITMGGHTQAVRRVKCDGFHGNILASCSYDFTVRLWDIGNAAMPLLETVAHHSEFTFGLDFCPLVPSKLADCSWDRTIKVFSPRCIASEPQP